MAIDRLQALEYLRSDDLIGLGMEADTLRHKLHPEGVVTYTVDRSFYYTNFCVDICGFCNSYALPTASRSNNTYIADVETIHDSISETLRMGGTGILMHGGLHSDGKIDWFENLLKGIKQRFPQISLNCFSAPEIVALARSSGLTVREAILRLRDAGLNSIPGDGAGILDDSVLHPAQPRACRAADWVNVHRTAHQLGMQTTAAMVIGLGETLEQRVHHLELIRQIQEDTGGFASFALVSFKSGVIVPEGQKWEEPTAVDYLKVVAVARLYLSNIDHIQSNWATQGLKVLQLALRFGGDDVGSVMLEKSLTAAALREHATSEEDLRRVIRDAGFRPVQRDTLYTTCYLN